VSEEELRLAKELVKEVRRLRWTLKLGIITYVVFWLIIIILIHVMMVPIVRGG